MAGHESLRDRNGEMRNTNQPESARMDTNPDRSA
jgi:hypothetical protein